MITGEMYAKYIICSWGLLMIFPVSLWTSNFIKYSWCYVNDEKYSHSKYWNWWLSTAYGDLEDPVLLSLGLFMCGFVWPLIIPVFIWFVGMNSIRFSFRVGKKLKRLGGVAHDHPDNIEHKHIETNNF